MLYCSRNAAFRCIPFDKEKTVVKNFALAVVLLLCCLSLAGLFPFTNFLVMFILYLESAASLADTNSRNRREGHQVQWSEWLLPITLVALCVIMLLGHLGVFAWDFSAICIMTLAALVLGPATKWVYQNIFLVVKEYHNEHDNRKKYKALLSKLQSE